MICQCNNCKHADYEIRDRQGIENYGMIYIWCSLNINNVIDQSYKKCVFREMLDKHKGGEYARIHNKEDI